MTTVRRHMRTTPTGRQRPVRQHEREGRTGSRYQASYPDPFEHDREYEDAAAGFVLEHDRDASAETYTDVGRETVDDAYRAIGWDPEQIRQLPRGNALRDQYERKIAENSPAGTAQADADHLHQYDDGGQFASFDNGDNAVIGAQYGTVRGPVTIRMPRRR